MLEQLGKYRIDGVLGQGAMGVVYKAFDPWIARVVALKTLRRDLVTEGGQEGLAERFRNEAQAAGRLHHPNIVTVFDYFEHGDVAGIAMEFVEGTPLDALIRPGQPTALPRVRAWMGDLLQGLDYAHARGVVHRDIKPGNLLVTADAQLKIGDFGIARIASSTLTQAGTMVGTPSYMSPEQFRGEPVDGRADVFSAGIVLYQLLTGARPFTGSAATVMQQILNVHPSAPSQVLPVLGMRFDAVVARAIAKAPADRYASARAFLEALQDTFDAADAALPPDSDRTVLAAGLPVFLPAAPTQDAGSATNGTITPWKRAALPEVEALLAHQIGPMARFLLKKVATQAAGLDQLGDLLLPHIPSDAGRLQFGEGLALLKKKLVTTGTGAGLAPGSTLPVITAPVAIDPAWADAAVSQLVALIGPIGRVVGKRALQATGDQAVFLQLLADHIAQPQQRARFLQDAGAPS